MEGNNWYNRTGYTDYRNHAQGDDRPLDQNVYRGAYRFDTERDGRRQDQYDNIVRSGRNRNFGTSEAYSNPRHHDYQRDWSGTYHNSRGAFDREDYGQEYDRHNRNQNMNQQQQYSSGLRDFREANDLNANPEYGPDHYGYGQGENYGNMAGSLSYGYDGMGTYNPDWNSRYDPMSGHLRSKHGNYPTRRPNFYDERDRRQNPDEFRPLGRLDQGY